MHFLASTRHPDGSIDYVVRTRIHTINGMERNFESHIRVSADRRLKLIRFDSLADQLALDHDVARVDQVFLKTELIGRHA